MDGDGGGIAGGRGRRSDARVEAAVGIAEGGDRRPDGGCEVLPRPRDLAFEGGVVAGGEVEMGAPVRPHLDAGGDQPAQRCRVEQLFPALAGPAGRPVPAVRASQLAAHREQGRGHAARRQLRHHLVAEAAAAVVEGEHDHAAGQPAPGAAACRGLGQGHRAVAVIGQGVEHGGELGAGKVAVGMQRRRHQVGGRHRLHVMEHQHRNAQPGHGRGVPAVRREVSSSA